MNRGLNSFRRRTGASLAEGGKLPFYLALGYLIWSILPHAAFRVHEHAGGSAAHTHLSFHDAGLKVGSTIAANPPEWTPGASESTEWTPGASGPAEPMESTVSAGEAAPTVSVPAAWAIAPEGMAESGIGPRAAHPQSFKPENPRHGHFTEDDNILATGISVSRILLPVPHPASLPASVLSPSLPYTGPATARGPPSRA